MFQRKPVDRARAQAIRADYAARMPVKEICTKHGISNDTLMYWVDGGPAEGADHLPPLQRRRARIAYPARTGNRRRLSGDRTAVVRRMWRTAEAQVLDIEQRVMREHQEPTERERDARVMAMLARTVRELVALDAARRNAKPNREAETGDDDPVPRDIDEFRRQLARKMEAFIAARADPGVPGNAVD